MEELFNLLRSERVLAVVYGSRVPFTESSITTVSVDGNPVSDSLLVSRDI